MNPNSARGYFDLNIDSIAVSIMKYALKFRCLEPGITRLSMHSHLTEPGC